MKTFLKYLAVFLLGTLVAFIPDAVLLYGDSVTHTYQDRYCTEKGIAKDECDFSTYFDPFKKENPKLLKAIYYFQMGESDIYYALSGKCSNKLFHNVSAVGDKSGKITLREYFVDRCSNFSIDVSDLIYGAGK